MPVPSFFCFLISILLVSLFLMTSPAFADHVFLQPFTNFFPRADICELLSPDLLHQLIKGTFKDHLVDWVERYIMLKYKKRKSKARAILDDIDRRYIQMTFYTN